MEIADLALRNGCTEIGMKSVLAGESIAQFRSRLVAAGAAKPVELGMSRSEIAQYNLGAAIENATRARGGMPSGFEGVIHGELAKRYGERGPHRLLIPIDVIRHHVRQSLATRADIVGTTSAGGYLVETQNMGFVELALAQQIFGLFGVPTLEGLVGNVNVPTLKSVGTTTDLASETTQAANNGQTFGQIALTPRTEATYFEVSRLLLRQTAPSTQTFLVNALLAAFRAHLEYLAIRGSGSAGQPTGILNAPGTNAVNLGGSPMDRLNLLSMQTATGDRLGPSGGYVMTRSVADTLAQRLESGVSSFTLWRGNLYQGIVGGFPAVSTSNMPSATIVFGNWANSVFAAWGTLELEVNPVVNFQAGIVGMRIIHALDFALTDPSAFTIATSFT
jgi:HK97 family phage major capsid protein